MSKPSQEKVLVADDRLVTLGGRVLALTRPIFAIHDEFLSTLTPSERAMYSLGFGQEKERQEYLLCKELGISRKSLRLRVFRLRKRFIEKLEAESFDPHATGLTDGAPAVTCRQTPLMEPLRHFLRTHFPVLYAQILEPTLSDLCQEHSDALAKGHPVKARWILLQGCGALAAATVCQLGVSLLGRIASLWQARSPK